MTDIHHRGPVYTASFQTTAATTTVADVLGIRASTASRVMVHEIKVAQPIEPSTTERISVALLRGSTASSTAAALTPRHLHGWTGVPTAGSSVTGPGGTVSTASAVLMDAASLIDGRWCHKPAPSDRIILEADQRLHVRVSAPSTNRLNGSIIWSEIGRPAST